MQDNLTLNADILLEMDKSFLSILDDSPLPQIGTAFGNASKGGASNIFTQARSFAPSSMR